MPVFHAGHIPFMHWLQRKDSLLYIKNINELFSLISRLFKESRSAGKYRFSYND